jgi:hypothetical protein
MKHPISFVLFSLLVLPFISCIGISGDISIRSNGSGKINLEYRIPQSLKTLGELDGNEGRQTIPTGRADFERTLARLPGTRLGSFSTKNEDGDIINRAELEFDRIESLLAFLDASGEGAVLGKDGGKNKLSLILLRGLTNADPDLLALIREVSGNYRFSLSFSVPGEAALECKDGAGNRAELPQSAKIVPAGKKVSFAIDMGELLSLPGGLGLDVSW